MRLSILTAVIVLVLLVLACADEPPVADAAPPGFGPGAFTALMVELAEAWNNGDAARAAACFTEDAVYLEPPDKQLYRGRAELFEFFGGEAGRPGAMRMTWHHLAFDTATEIGFGEFSFTYGTTVHGIVVVRLRGGKIANWREYWYASELPWEEFTVENPF